MNRTEIINFLISKFDYNKYLEIGVQRTHQNFDHIIASDKTGVDPALKLHPAVVRTSSDVYFQSIEDSRLFDIIFIDGLHTADQSFKDFENAVQHLERNGCIVMHDLLPKNEEYTLPMWCGDVWKTGIHFAKIYKSVVVPEDHGVGVFFPDLRSTLNIPEVIHYPGLKDLEGYFGVTADFKKDINDLQTTLNGSSAA